MSNLYNRRLLTDFSRIEIEDLLSESISWVNDQKNLGDKDVKAALLSRLRFRKSFMAAVTFGDDDDDLDSPSAWQECSNLLPLLLESKAAGSDVTDAFSAKIQRRLASTVPPRPIVNITFEEAHAHLSRLCQDGKQVYGVLDYHGGNNMLVNHTSGPIGSSNYLYYCVDFCLGVPIPKPAAFGIHSMPAAITHLQ